MDLQHRLEDKSRQVGTMHIYIQRGGRRPSDSSVSLTKARSLQSLEDTSPRFRAKILEYDKKRREVEKTKPKPKPRPIVAPSPPKPERKKYIPIIPPKPKLKPIKPPVIPAYLEKPPVFEEGWMLLQRSSLRCFFFIFQSVHRQYYRLLNEAFVVYLARR